jgi:polysaccharide biosynthesis protein PslH
MRQNLGQEGGYRVAHEPDELYGPPVAIAQAAIEDRAVPRKVIPRTALVIPGTLDERLGGAALRWDSLRRSGGFTPMPMRCDRNGEFCGNRCHLAGVPTVGGPPGDLYAHANCTVMATRLDALLGYGRFRVAVFSGLRVHWYCRNLAIPHRIFDMHNVEVALRSEIHDAASPGSGAAAKYNESHLSLTYDAERDALRAAEQIWACSLTDIELAARVYPEIPRAKYRLIPNSVAVPAVRPTAGTLDGLVFVGRLDYLPNMQAVQELVLYVAPELTKVCPAATVLVAGGHAPRVLRELKHPGNVRFVHDPAEVANLLTGRALAVPLRIGGGTRFKILQAFAAGALVLATRKGIEGLGAVPGVHYIEIENAAHLVSEYARLASSPAARGDLIASAYELVCQQFSLAALKPRVQAALEELD